MLTASSNAWSYSFSVTDGTESVAQAVDLSWWEEKGGKRGGRGRGRSKGSEEM